jgi:hypothetical protein
MYDLEFLYQLIIDNHLKNLIPFYYDAQNTSLSL